MPVARAVVLRGVHDQPAPTATDVQQVLAGLKAQFAAGQFQLGGLCGVQVFRARLEVRATVDHARIQKQRVEIVAQIVVRAHVVGVLGFRVDVSAQAGFGTGQLRLRR